MGTVYKANLGLKQNYGSGPANVRNALLQTGQLDVSVKAAELSADEVDIILLKADQLASSWNNEAIAQMVLEEMESILIAIRMVKEETKEPFQGIRGLGSALDMVWLRPRHVGQTATLNKDATTGKGLYGGTSGAVYSWLHSFVAGTGEDIIPSQTMSEEAAVVHLGLLTTVEIPKIDAITFALQGVSSPTQPVAFSHRASIGTDKLPLIRFEKPIIIGPEKQQQVTLVPNITGDDKVELVSLLIARVSDLIA